YYGLNYSSGWDADLLARATGKGRTAVGYVNVFIHGLREDRQQLFANSLIRSLALVTAAALVITLYILRRMRPALMLGIVGVLAFGDILSMDLNYLNGDNYKERADYQQNFSATDADRQIMADKGYYRVFDLRDSMSSALTYGAMTAYFHNSIGGYHAARLKIYEDLINRQLFNFPNCAPVINMLNTRYIIKPSKDGDSVVRNKGSLGPVWFVKGVKYERSAQDVMNALSKFHPADTAILFARDSARVRVGGETDSTGYIQLLKNDNDQITYVSQSRQRQFAVFSEVYYDRGWEAYVDGKEVPIIRTNYVLRGLSLAPGRHIIKFFFRPLSYYLGRQVQWMATIVLVLMIVGMAVTAVQESSFRRRSAQVSLPAVS
ncbi:MAG TPA: YfhO family protein, partial [Puia sp.]|nr:YfhO family protein [Puia sp.]